MPDVVFYAQEEEFDEDVEGESVRNTDLETVSAFTGASTHVFISINKLHYTQEEIQTLFQTNAQCLLSLVSFILTREVRVTFFFNYSEKFKN